MTDLSLITYEAKMLATQVNDLADIARHLNRVHGKNYQVNDIQKLLSGIKPTASIPRQNPSKAKLMADPIAWTPPISTNRRGFDPLAKACLEYGVKHGGVMGADVASCEAMLKAISA